MGLFARYLEDRGISTVTLSNLRGRSLKVKPPRTLLVPDRRGETAGPPGDRQAQERRVVAALRLLETATEPGTLIEFAE